MVEQLDSRMHLAYKFLQEAINHILAISFSLDSLETLIIFKNSYCFAELISKTKQKSIARSHVYLLKDFANLSIERKKNKYHEIKKKPVSGG